MEFHLERLFTHMNWNREHLTSFKQYRHSDSEKADREIDHLDDSLDRGYNHLVRFVELLRAGYQPSIND
ncbi:MAG: hypothetical protein KDA84_04500 [Planctomycetaceae bacterium]|nr:hypothetical protein [Planctomycetaceae bacterium]